MIHLSLPTFLAFLLTFSANLTAQTVPALPEPSVGFFATPENSPVTFEVQTAHGSGTMGYWRCEAMISPQGTITGNATIFGFVGKSSTSGVQTVSFNGTLSNPRRSWSGEVLAIAGGSGQQLAADYTADFVARTTKPHNHSFKGVLIFRYLVDFEPVGSGELAKTRDQSRREAAITVFNARGPVGSVVRFDHPYSAWNTFAEEIGVPSNNPPAPVVPGPF
jgi:hypothetical protein